ncbi:Cell growth-regulating nucleolar protein [Pteropus alecto]|uniref:Cell growth-regulating nucleolar protein n=1 Tax=Pteropus alecto TaxID=9402 RepID=L5K6U5_PTEAL|nr:Cell growth-regulating nucleolar protein [Pteropus alecto]
MVAKATKKVNELIKRPNVSPKVKELLEQISGFDNIPRKRAKFQNWMKNSLKIHNESILEQVWNIFSEASSSGPVSKGQDERPHNQVAHPPAETSTKVPPPRANDTTEGQTEVKKNKRERKEAKKELKLANHRESSKSHKPKRRKAGQETEQAAGGADAKASAAGKRSRGKDGDGAHGRDTAGEGVQTSPGRRKRKLSEGKFNWKGTIKAILKQAPDNEIAIKKLRKKVLAQYYAVTDEHHKSEEELLVIFNKKLSKNPTFKLLKGKAKLVK